MAAPGKITINSITPGVLSLTINFTRTAPLTSTKTYIRYKKTFEDAWTVLDILAHASPFTLYNIDTATAYNVSMMDINENDSPDTYGEWSDISTETVIANGFGNLVHWAPAGFQTGPFIDNTGTFGAPPSNYDLDTHITGGGNVQSAVRNNYNVFQTTFGDAGIRIASPPPSDSLPQTLDIFMCFVPFFVDGTFRWLMAGSAGNLEIRMSNVGFSATVNGVGIFNLGSITTSAQLYVLNFIMSGTTSSLRVLDDTGQDVSNSANINYTGDVFPEALGWNSAQSAGSAGNAQYMESRLAAIANQPVRDSIIAGLFQKFSLTHADRALILPDYRIASGDINLDDTTSVGSAIYTPPSPGGGTASGKKTLSTSIGINI